MGEVAVEVEVADYKNFGGILFPTRSKQKAGAQQMEITITGVSLDPPIAAELFELPADIKTLVAKSAGK
jgi:hypothetical protein